MKKIYFSKFKDQTIASLKEKEAEHRKKAAEAQELARQETAFADDLLRERNFRRLPQAQKAYQDLQEIKAILHAHATGTSPLSKTRLKKLERAEEVMTKHLDGILLYGGYMIDLDEGDKEVNHGKPCKSPDKKEDDS